MAELSPASPLEQTLAREIIHAAWRLRRCANLEVAPPEDLTDEELDRLQISIDRARSAAQRTFHRSLKELRRLQAGHLEPAVLMIEQAKAMDALLKKDLEARQRELTETAVDNSAKQTQSEPAKTPSDPPQRPVPLQIRAEIQALLRQKRPSGSRQRGAPPRGSRRIDLLTSPS